MIATKPFHLNIPLFGQCKIIQGYQYLLSKFSFPIIIKPGCVFSYFLPTLYFKNKNSKKSLKKKENYYES